MSDFFVKKKVSDKCKTCPLNKKDISKKENNISIYKKGTGDILFILEMPEKDNYIEGFKNWLTKNKINSYEIRLGLKCQKFDLPNPLYKIYKTCNTIKEKDINSKVIITIGRAINSITQNDDLVNWKEFSEYQFNQTYFYTPLKWKKKLRVYPIPALFEWLFQDNFEKFFLTKQIDFVKRYLDNYEEERKKEKFKSYNIEKVENVNKFLSDNIDKIKGAFDLETSHLDHFADDFNIRCLTTSFDGINGYYLSYEKINKRLLAKFFKDKYGIWANGKFDTKAMKLVSNINTVVEEEDVTLLHHVLNIQRKSNSIKALSWLIGFGGYEDELEDYKELYKITNYFKISEKVLVSYAVLDSIITYRLYEFGLELAKKQPKVYEMYRKYIIPVIPVFQDMEIRGMNINIDYLNKLNSKLENDARQLEKEIQEELGEKFQLTSSEQLAVILEINGWSSKGKSTKKYWLDNNNEQHYFYKVGISELEEWEKEGKEAAAKIIKYRKISKLLSSFVGEVKDELEDDIFFEKKSDKKIKNDAGLAKYIKRDGLIHPNYGPGRNSTIRTMCSDPNAQQFSKQKEEGKLYRPVFACPDDYYIVEADYSGFHLRIIAIECSDENMKDIFINHGGDIHSRTGCSVFHRGMKLEEFIKNKNQEPYKTSRFEAKKINFGFAYGRQSITFKSVLEKEWSIENINNYIKENNLKLLELNDAPNPYFTVADDIRNKFFETYPKIKIWIEKQHKLAEKNGYVDSIQCGRMHLPFLKYVGKNYDRKVYSKFYNLSVNAPIQNFEAIYVYEKMINISNRIKKDKFDVQFMNMTHDSNAFYVNRKEIKDFYFMLKEEMEDHTTWEIPITVDVSIGESWGFSDEIKSEKDLEKF